MNIFRDTEPAQSSPIEPEALESVRAIDPLGTKGVVQKMIANYFESTPKHIATLHEGVALRDADRIRRAAHSLKSNSAFVGARQLARLCESLETLARQEAIAEAMELLPAVRPEYERVRAALEAERAA